LILHGEVDSKALEVNDQQKHHYSGEKTPNIREVVPIKGFFERFDFVGASNEEMKESNNGAFELCSAAGVDGGGRKRFPDYILTDVGRDEEGNA
jgi:hypothetical protein